MGKDAAEVERGLYDVLDQLADAVELEGGDRREQVREGLAELSDDAWQVRPPAAPKPQAERAVAPPPVPRADQEEDLPYFTPKEERPKAWPIILLVLLVAALVITAIMVFSSGSDEDDSPPASDAGKAPAEAPPADSPPPEPTEDLRSAKLVPVRGSNHGTGEVTLNAEGDRLKVSISRLPQPKGSYEIWVYTSIVDSQSLGSFRDTKIELDARLPDDLENYRYVDVSLEPKDGNPNHSGDSVLRAPVDELLIG